MFTVSELLQRHAQTEVSTEISHIHQTSVWKTLYSDDGFFQGELSLSLCTDGINPFAKEKNTYSM